MAGNEQDFIIKGKVDLTEAMKAIDKAMAKVREFETKASSVGARMSGRTMPAGGGSAISGTPIVKVDMGGIANILQNIAVYSQQTNNLLSSILARMITPGATGMAGFTGGGTVSGGGTRTTRQGGRITAAVTAQQMAAQERDAARELRRHVREKFELEKESRTGTGREAVVENVFRRALLFSAVSAGIFKAVDAAGQFFDTMVKMDKQIADLRKTLSGTEADFNRLVNNATRIARTYKASTQDVLDAIELFSAQFKDTEDLEKLSKAAILFSNISGQDLKVSAEIITSTIQQYNLSVSEAEHITDAWANVAANSAVKVKDLGDAIGASGGAAKTAGVGLDELNGMIAAIAASTGRSGKEIGTALKRIFERSTSPENVKELNKLGVLVHDQIGNFRNFGDVIFELSGRWDNLSSTQQKQIAVAFAGARQYDAFIALMNHYSEATSLAEKSQNSFGAAQRQNDRIAETFVKKLQALTVEYDKLARTSGEDTLPVFGKLIDSLTKMLQLFNDSPKAIRQFTMALAGISAAGAVGSLLFKFLFTDVSGTGGLMPRTGSRLAQKIGPSVIGPTVFSAGETGGVSLLGGLGRNIAQKGLFGKGAGLLGGAVAGTGTDAAIGAFAIGLTTLVAAIAGVVAAFVGLSKVLEGFSDKTKEAIEKQDEALRTGLQEGSGLDKLARKSEDLAEEFAGITGGKDRSRFARETITPFVKDVLSKQPELIKGIGIDFDQFGNVININSDKLIVLAKALDQAAAAAARMAATSAMGTSIEERGGLFGFGGEVVTGMNAAQQLGRRFGNIGVGTGGVSTFSGAQNKFVTTPTLSVLNAIRQGINTGQINPKNLNLEAARTALGPVGSSLSGSQLEDLIKTTSDTLELQRVNQKAADVIINDARARFGQAKTKDQRTKILSTIRQSIANFNKAITGQFGKGQEAPATLAHAVLPPFEERQIAPGALGPVTGKSRARVADFDITRIDLELNKSLVTNARNFQLFGGEIKFVSNAIEAYKAAIKDLASDTQKAAGPQEEVAFMSRQQRIAELKQEMANINKEGISSKEKETKLLQKQFEIESLQRKQGIQAINEEREKGIELLKQELHQLEAVQDIQESIRGPLTQAMGGALGNVRERNLALGQSNILGERGVGDLEAQLIFARMRFAQAQQAQGMNGTANTAAGRNELKRIQTEIRQIEKQMDQVNEKTNIWKSLLENIGGTLINRLSSRFADFIIEGFGSLAGGKNAKGFSLFGQTNPQVDALNNNTTALNKLVAVLTGQPLSSGAIGATIETSGAPSDGDKIADKLEKGINVDIKQTSLEKWTKGAALAFGSALAGAGVGAAFTAGLGRTGLGGTIGGAVGGLAGSAAGLFSNTNPLLKAAGPIMQSIFPLVGGFIGALFDKPISAEIPELDELENPLDNMVFELQKLEKSLNTLNDTMENIINAPSNFVLPIPKGILENSITAQSAIATPLQAGGLILKSGPAFLHKGDVVNGVSDRMGGDTSITNSIVINGANKDPQTIAQEVMEKLNTEFFRQNQRTGNYLSRF